MPLVTEPTDLLLDSTGDLVVGTDLAFSSGIAAVAQGIRVRIQVFRGEWFLDLDFGVPYYQDLLGHKFNKPKAHAAFRNAILSTPGVTELISLATEFGGVTRTLNVTWEARTAFGDTPPDTLNLEV